MGKKDKMYENLGKYDCIGDLMGNAPEWESQRARLLTLPHRNIQFEVKWSLGDTTWEPLANCNELAALDSYLSLMGVSDWRDLRRCAVGTARGGK